MKQVLNSLISYCFAEQSIQTTTEEREGGVASTIFRSRLVGEPERWVAIKISPAKRKFSPEPHDLIKEIELLTKLSHINIIEVAGSSRSGAAIELYTPWIPHSLETLLDIPTFSPRPIPSQARHLFRSSKLAGLEVSREDIFKTITKSVIYQVIRGLEYLHGLKEPIGHRDIKPRNVLIDTEGCIKLIDFGIAYQESTSADIGNLWPETKENMYSDVATGPFRSPELLFGPKTYDACATDLWSLGCTMASFFTPIRLRRKSYDGDYNGDEEEEEGSDDYDPPAAYLLPKDIDAITFRSADWMRQTLFDSRRGSIGLAWSIFKLRGTPNEVNWPHFEDLPDANKIQFKVVPSRDICTRLPNLPPDSPSTGSEHKPPKDFAATPLDLIHRLLVYPPEDRLKAAAALKHPWFTSFEEDIPLLLPIGKNGYEECEAKIEWKGKDFGHWFRIAYGGQ
ncbi:hypothetical protein ACEPAH_4065 [Sanghuangporus vaninii]